jgi:hypothetical protein
MSGSSYLVDTNILLRLVQPDSPEYGTIRQCTDRLWAEGVEEKWAVPVAFVVLLIPSFILSGYVESRLLDRKRWLRYGSSKAVWQANLLSYICLAACGGLALARYVARS